MVGIFLQIENDILTW